MLKLRLCRRMLLVGAFCIAPALPVWAHLGPPIQIVQEQPTGPFRVSVWTHPDLGTGTFFVIVDPAPGKTVPNDVKVQIAVQPVNGRLPEAISGTERDPAPDHVQFNGYAQFDKQEPFRVRVMVQSSAGGGNVLSQITPTPTTLGQLHVVLWSFPFFFFAYLWYRGMSRRKKQMRKRRAAKAAARITALTVVAPGPAQQGNS